ncbi:hypothetical protein AAHE18_07G048600 [Arachis hypogaea]
MEINLFKNHFINAWVILLLNKLQSWICIFSLSTENESKKANKCVKKNEVIIYPSKSHIADTPL